MSRFDTPKIRWTDWYQTLSALASSHGESVADREAWMEPWGDGETPEDAFFEEYPEYAPAVSLEEAAPATVAPATAVGKSCVTAKKQHTKPCAACPWKRSSAPGWLGASEPGEFLAQADTLVKMPCHLHVDYEAADWKAKADAAPQCAGRAIFLANRCKLPMPGQLKLPADRDQVFTRPHEFVAHHAALDPSSLETTMLFDLYDIKRATSESTT